MTAAIEVGREIARVTFPVERGKLRELALAFHDEDPLWHDDRAARAAGFDAVPTPPTVTALVAHHLEGGLIGAPLALGLDVDRLLHGEAAWTIARPVRPGDRLTAVLVVADVTHREGRRGGTMTLVTVETTFTAADGAHVATLRDVWVETAA